MFVCVRVRKKRQKREIERVCESEKTPYKSRENDYERERERRRER